VYHIHVLTMLRTWRSFRTKASESLREQCNNAAAVTQHSSHGLFYIITTITNVAHIAARRPDKPMFGCTYMSVCNMSTTLMVYPPGSQPVLLGAQHMAPQLPSCHGVPFLWQDCCAPLRSMQLRQGPDSAHLCPPVPDENKPFWLETGKGLVNAVIASLLWPRQPKLLCKSIIYQIITGSGFTGWCDCRESHQRYVEDIGRSRKFSEGTGHVLGRSRRFLA
jgi:hypothetical protein